MQYVTASHRFAAEIIDARPDYAQIWAQITASIEGVTDQAIIGCFQENGGGAKSISKCVNSLLKAQLTQRGWAAESAIFQDAEYHDNRWRLDFAKEPFSIEVAFNHGEAIAWNLLKPVMASELNHVAKAVTTRIGVIICAAGELKDRGGFDSAVGEFEKIERYLRPLNNVLTVPMVLIGLRAPETFRISHRLDERRHNIGTIVMEPRPPSRWD